MSLPRVDHAIEAISFDFTALVSFLANLQIPIDERIKLHRVRRWNNHSATHIVSHT